jgi:hypothetical protein
MSFARPRTVALSPIELAVLALTALIALALQSLVVPIDADVSWLITVSERVLSGDRLYVDIFEVNPPASVWLYLPQVAVAQLIHVRPEAMIVAVTTALALISVVATARLNNQFRAIPRLPLLAILGVVTLVLPGGLFAQREHYALLLALPVAWTMALIASGKRVGLRSLLLAGLAAGLIIVIKPQFVFAVALPAIFAAVAGQGWRAVAVAACAGLAAIFVYALAIAALAPAYLGLLPMLAEVYGPMREHWPKLLLGVSVVSPLALCAAAVVLSARPVPRLTLVLILMIIGFTIAVVIQGKGYWNHALPGIALALVALTVSMLRPGPSTHRSLELAALAMIGVGVAATTFMIQPPPGLVGALRETAPPHPSVITLGTDLWVGHPATRLVDGRWAGTRAALFTAAGVRYRTGNLTEPSSATYRHWYDEDLALLARDVDWAKPDVLLVEREDMGWLAKEPVAQQILRQYRPARTVGGVEIWLRRSGPAPQ